MSQDGINPFTGQSDPAYNADGTPDTSSQQATITNTGLDPNTGLPPGPGGAPAPLPRRAVDNPAVPIPGNVNPAPDPTPTPPPAPAPGGGISSGLLAPYSVAPPTIPTAPSFQLTPFSAPSASDAMNDPGYAFSVQQGENALQNWAAAKGTLNDSGTANALTQYGQQSAGTQYQNVWNRDFNSWSANNAAALSAYNTNYQTQYKDPFTAAYDEWQQQGQFYLGNQGIAVPAALNYGNA